MMNEIIIIKVNNLSCIIECMNEFHYQNKNIHITMIIIMIINIITNMRQLVIEDNEGY